MAVDLRASGVESPRVYQTSCFLSVEVEKGIEPNTSPQIPPGTTITIELLLINKQVSLTVELPLELLVNRLQVKETKTLS